MKNWFLTDRAVSFWSALKVRDVEVARDALDILGNGDQTEKVNPLRDADAGTVVVVVPGVARVERAVARLLPGSRSPWSVPVVVSSCGMARAVGGRRWPCGLPACGRRSDSAA